MEGSEDMNGYIYIRTDSNTCKDNVLRVEENLDAGQRKYKIWHVLKMTI